MPSALRSPLVWDWDRKVSLNAFVVISQTLWNRPLWGYENDKTLVSGWTVPLSCMGQYILTNQHIFNPFLHNTSLIAKANKQTNTEGTFYNVKRLKTKVPRFDENCLKRLTKWCKSEKDIRLWCASIMANVHLIITVALVTNNLGDYHSSRLSAH